MTGILRFKKSETNVIADEMCFERWMFSSLYLKKNPNNFGFEKAEGKEKNFKEEILMKIPKRNNG